MLTIYEPTTDNELLIWACESRNSDNIMVITADRSCSDINDMFNDTAWRSAKYFKYDEYDKAVNHVYNIIKKQFNKFFLEEYNTKFKMHKCIADLQHIQVDAKDLDYEDYYDLATFEDVDNLYFCDLIILEGKMGLRYSKYTDAYKDEFDNLIFEEWEPDLTSDTTLMLGMQKKLRDFIEKEIDYDINIGIGIQGGRNISTRARIGILKKDGSIESIYCHHDGYLDGVGKILNDNYQNYNDVKELIKLGNISGLGKKINSDNKKDETIAYHRNLGEDYKKNKPMVTKSFDEFQEILFDAWIGYIYLYDEQTNKWLWDNYTAEVSNLELKSLSDCFKKEVEKPLAPIIGADGNVFNLIGICSRALKNAGYPDKAKEMTDRITSSGSYDEALSIMCEYIEPVNQNYEKMEDINDYDDIYINLQEDLNVKRLSNKKN